MGLADQDREGQRVASFRIINSDYRRKRIMAYQSKLDRYSRNPPSDTKYMYLIFTTSSINEPVKWGYSPWEKGCIKRLRRDMKDFSTKDAVGFILKDHFDADTYSKAKKYAVQKMWKCNNRKKPGQISDDISLYLSKWPVSPYAIYILAKKSETGKRYSDYFVVTEKGDSYPLCPDKWYFTERCRPFSKNCPKG